MIFYRLLCYCFFILSLPFLPLIWLMSAKRRANLFYRLGMVSKITSENREEEFSREKGLRIWVHALSVGEVVSALPLVRDLKKECPCAEIIFTATTKTGFDRAKALMMDVPKPVVDQLGYFPFDIGFCIRRVVAKIRPDLVMMIETDIWPNFIRILKQQKIHTVLVNARLSRRSLKGYLKFAAFFRKVFNAFSLIFVQSDLDLERYTRLGIETEKIKVAGNIKFDQPIQPFDEKEVLALKEKMGLSGSAKILTAGSTHDPEERVLIQVFKKLQAEISDLVLILAPRDPARAVQVNELCRQKNFDSVLYSRIFQSSNGRESSAKRVENVFVIDRMGVLVKIYSICDVAFVGGSMVEQGGHNPLEPAALAKPVVFGKDMSDFDEISKLLLHSGGAEQVDSESHLFEVLKKILTDPVCRQHMGKNSFQVFDKNCGAVNKIVKELAVLTKGAVV